MARPRSTSKKRSRSFRAGRLDVEEMITHRLPLAQAQEGFRLVAQAG